MIRHIYSLFALLFAFSLGAQDKIELIEIASGFDTPLGIEHAGDHRLFIVEKDGTISLMDTNGVVFAGHFLDIDARVNSNAGERGLLGLAFHPDYADNGFFYVNYTNLGGSTVIARFSRDPNDPDRADPDSEMILLTQSQPFQNHNGGHLAFGPDGYLYIGLGDGGSGGDPGNRAQNPETFLGKMLRIDVDGGAPYAIPPDNPFVGVDSILPEIWATGLRNPWRYSFDRITGDLWIADVGQDAWEEISFQPASSTGGENYGWRCKEGFANFNLSGCPPMETLTDPVYVYAHMGQNCSGSVTGGYAYHGNRNPYLNGKYVFTDYCTGVFRALAPDSLGGFEAEDLANLQNFEFTAFGQDASGELYVAGGSGRIYVIRDLVSGLRNIERKPITITPNPTRESFVVEGEMQGSVRVSVQNVFGQVVFQQPMILPARITLEDFPSGVYTVVVEEARDAVGVGKLVLTR